MAFKRPLLLAGVMMAVVLSSYAGDHSTAEAQAIVVGNVTFINQANAVVIIQTSTGQLLNLSIGATVTLPLQVVGETATLLNTVTGVVSGVLTLVPGAVYVVQNTVTGAIGPVLVFIASLIGGVLSLLASVLGPF